MKRYTAAVCASMMSVCFAQTELVTPQDKNSYALGVALGKNMQAQQIDLNIDVFTQGFQDGISGNKKLLLTDEQLNQTMSAFQQQMVDKQKMKLKTESNDNLQAGQDFLAKNKTKDGVATTASGLQYKVLEAGKGNSPKKTDQVVVHYEGRLIDGTVFDSSYARKQPATFGVNQVIAGWTEALQLMSPGATWELYIPASLAYGSRGAPPQIGPNAVLIFKVNLVSVKS